MVSVSARWSVVLEFKIANLATKICLRGLKGQGSRRGGERQGGGGGPRRSDPPYTSTIKLNFKSLFALTKGYRSKRHLFKSLHGGQFTISTQSITQNFSVLLPYRQSTTVSLEAQLPPLFAFGQACLYLDWAKRSHIWWTAVNSSRPK